MILEGEKLTSRVCGVCDVCVWWGILRYPPYHSKRLLVLKPGQYQATTTIKFPEVLILHNAIRSRTVLPSPDALSTHLQECVLCAAHKKHSFSMCAAYRTRR